MFFNELIQQNICKIDILSRHNRNTQSDDEYYLYNYEDKKIYYEKWFKISNKL